MSKKLGNQIVYILKNAKNKIHTKAYLNQRLVVDTADFLMGTRIEKR